MPVVHLPSLGVFLPTLLARYPCMSFPRSRATDYHYLGSKVPKGQVRTGPGAPTGCTKLDAGRGQLHALPCGLQQTVPPQRASCEQGLSEGNLAWQQGGRWVYAKWKYQGDLCPCFTLSLPLTLCYSSCRLPQQFSDSIKLSSFPPPPQLVILKLTLLEDKVRRHRPTSLESSSKVHVKPSGQLAIPVLPENKTVNAEPLSVPGLLRAVAPPRRRSANEVW